MTLGNNSSGSPSCRYLSANSGSTEASNDDFSVLPIYAGFADGTELNVLANDVDLEGDNQQVISVDGQTISGDGEVNSITTANGFKVWRNESGTLQVSALLEQPEGSYSLDYTVQDDGEPSAQATATITLEVVKAVAMIAGASHTGSAFQIDHTGSVGSFVQLAVDSNGDSTYDLFSAVSPLGTLLQIAEPFTPGSIVRLQVFADAGGTIVLAEAQKALPANTIIIAEAAPDQPIIWSLSDDSDPASSDASYLPGGDVISLSMAIVGGGNAGTYNLPVAAGFASIDISGLPAGLQAILSNAGNVITANSLADLFNAEITSIQINFGIAHHYSDGSSTQLDLEDIYALDPVKLFDSADLTLFDKVEGVASGKIDEFKLSWANFGIWPFNGSNMLNGITVDTYERPANGDPDILLSAGITATIVSDPGNGTVTISTPGFNTQAVTAGNEKILVIDELVLAKSTGGDMTVNTTAELWVSQYIAVELVVGSSISNAIFIRNYNQTIYLTSHSGVFDYTSVRLFKGDDSGTLLYDNPVLAPTSIASVAYPSPYNNVGRAEAQIVYKNLKSWAHGYKENMDMDIVSLLFTSRVGNTFQVCVLTKTLVGGALDVTGNANYYAINEDNGDVLASGSFTDTQLNSPTSSAEIRTDLNFSFTAPKGARVKIGIAALRSGYAGPEAVHMGSETQLVVF